MRVLGFAAAALVLACSQNPPPASGVGAWEDVSARLSAFAPSGDYSLAADFGLHGDTLSDSALARLLALRLTLPARVTVAVLYFPAVQRGPRGWWMHREAPELSAAMSESTLAALRRIPRVHRALPLPQLVVGDSPTPTVLRTAAARLQADLLLAYRPRCSVWERAPFIGRREFRCLCTVEAVMLDTRTGLIPFAVVRAAADTTYRQGADVSVDATVLRSQTTATLAALVSLIDSSAVFLTAAPRAAETVQPN
jgi:hypothetical protein